MAKRKRSFWSKGIGGNGLKHFPPKTPSEETEMAEDDLQKCFDVANFVEFAIAPSSKP